MPKFLIIRFSSIGDIIQCMGVVEGIKTRYPDAQIEWITRKDMSSILSMDSRIDKVWAFDKKEGLKGLLKIIKELKKEKYDYVYDAHSNIRSMIIKFLLKFTIFHRPKFALRSKERFKRFLLFNFRINRFDYPFKGRESFRKPLIKWGITQFSEKFENWSFSGDIQTKFKDLINPNSITLAPSANWEMKRWSIGHWQRLIELLPERNFIILGGPDDHFCEEIRSVAPDRVQNLAGRCSLLESCYIAKISNVLVSGDTGILHAGDLFKVPTLALIGPTAFGFPSGEKSQVLEVDLPCRPCTKDGRGACKDSIYKRCMVEITPELVASKLQ